MLAYIDATYISDWLQRANRLVTELQAWWAEEDNSVIFTHFWLSEISDEKRQELLELEVGLLKAEVELAFSVGLESNAVSEKDIVTLFRVVLWEYTRTISEDCGRSFIDTISVLAQSKLAAYRELLSHIRCSTANTTYAQWLLGIRSFALISLASAVITFFKSYCESEASARPPQAGSSHSPATIVQASGKSSAAALPAPRDPSEITKGNLDKGRNTVKDGEGPGLGNALTMQIASLDIGRGAHRVSLPTTTLALSHRPTTAGMHLLPRPGTAGDARPTTAVASRTHIAAVDEFFGAVKLGHLDVVERMLARGLGTSGLMDGLGRTPLLVAVVHRRHQIVEYLLKQRLCDVNMPAASGNTALHVAVNMGDATLVRMLVAGGADTRAINDQCNATPYDLAVLHGSKVCFLGWRRKERKQGGDSMFTFVCTCRMFVIHRKVTKKEPAHRLNRDTLSNSPSHNRTSSMP